MANKKQTIKQPRNYATVIGMLQIFVLVSIVYSSYIVFMGTQGVAPKVMLVPQVLWAAILVVRRFTQTN